MRMLQARSLTRTLLPAMVGSLVLAACAQKPESKPPPAAAPAPAPASTPAPRSFEWQRFKGSTLNLLLTKHPYVDKVMENIANFEKLTGIKVNAEVLPEIQARQKLTVEMAAGGGG